MKKKLLSVAAVVLGIAAMHGQAYVSLSGGYGFQSNQKVVGKDATNIAAVSDLKGSYGEGYQAQLRGGYFFTKRLGAELALGYLHGGDIATNKNQILDMTAHGRAFGASLSAVFNITDNLYVRAGAVTKIGGKTESTTKLNANLPLRVFSPLAPNTTVNMKADFQTNFHGKIPFGFIGGIGYRFNVTDKISLFVEGEYLNISVPRKTSKLDSFSATRTIGGVTSALSLQEFKGYMEKLKNAPSLPQTERLKQLANQISPLLEDEYSWEGKGAPDAPYSSIGFHFGVTYKL
ncbi:outer membrane beta-barrel protein [Capnocytophaga leadbetteri]|uniref:outer membrane beta-barrel protein n=1 Tax=Capnocytophaga leadbetteri TaxID=327575 RepID=UPI0028E6152D|nr:outer membrane beta-barrel protein [Capnocytophaga leadbetteri]